MYQDITETMLGLLGNIFQSIYFCFDNYQVYPLIWSISGYLQVSYLLQQDEYLANITRAGCSDGQCWADCSCSCNDPEHNTGQGHSQGSLRDLGQQPRHHLNNLINISKLGLVFIFTSSGMWHAWPQPSPAKPSTTNKLPITWINFLLPAIERFLLLP